MYSQATFYALEVIFPDLFRVWNILIGFGVWPIWSRIRRFWIRNLRWMHFIRTFKSSMFWLKILSACDRTSLWFPAQQVKYVSHRSTEKEFKRKSLPGKFTTLLLHETVWAEFMFWRCKFLKPVQKLATQKLSRKTSAHPCHTASTFMQNRFAKNCRGDKQGPLC